MKRTISLLLVLSLVFFVLCLILAPIVCMPVSSDEYFGTFEVDKFRPTMVSFALSIISAICACLFVQKLAAKNGKTVNSLIMGLGIGSFGLFYGLRAAYCDAADVLSNFYSTWGPNGSSVAHLMPEWADKFEHTAGTYTFFVVSSVIIALIGIYRVYNDLHRV